MKILIAAYLFIGMFITFVGEQETIRNEGQKAQLNIIQRLTMFCTWPIFVAIALYRRLKGRDL
jgi:hypothetical protein